MLSLRCVVKYEYFRIGLLEVVSIVPKTAFIIAAVALDWFTLYGIMIFGVGQLLYSLTMMALFYLNS